MFWTLELVTGPDEEPVTLAEMRQHLREFDGVTDNDAQIEGLITAAREWAEGYTGRALVEETWRQTMTSEDRQSDLPASQQGYARDVRSAELLLRRSPVLGIVSVKAVDTAGEETESEAETYEVRQPNSRWPRLYALNGGHWAAGSGDLVIEFRAGFIDTTGSPPTGEVPQRFKQAIKLHVEAHYDRDETMMKLLLDAAANLLRNERAELSMA